MGNLVKLENDTLAKLYDQMLNRVNLVYKEGFYAWTMKERPDIAKRLEILDKQINEVWEKCITGDASMDMFKAGVKLYEDCVRKSLLLMGSHP
jgi:hypothetical protein